MGNLTFQPVRRYGVPAYPTKLSIAADPTLLRQHVPSAWLAQREIAAAAGALLVVGTMGCPPLVTPGIPAAVEAFSEATALEIIRDELRLQGLAAIASEAELPGVTLATASGGAEPLVVDLSDPEWKWALEYVTYDDYIALEAGLPTGTGDLAARLTDYVAAQAEDVHFQALRAPYSTTGDINTPQPEAESQLRAQVKDFVDWLKAQGVI
ncbi:MAG: hypothetical protein KA383_04345 [Phycisphaerae bacterium]|nr:hypothetical protein [Phycisphaerae bacterium]